MWKFSEQDIVERRHWTAYIRAYEKLLSKCSTEWAPWYVIPANHKWYRNLAVAETIVRALRKLRLRYPPPAIPPSRLRRIRL